MLERIPKIYVRRNNARLKMICLNNFVIYQLFLSVYPLSGASAATAGFTI